MHYKGLTQEISSKMQLKVNIGHQWLTVMTAVSEDQTYSTTAVTIFKSPISNQKFQHSSVTLIYLWIFKMFEFHEY